MKILKGFILILLFLVLSVAYRESNTHLQTFAHTNQKNNASFCGITVTSGETPSCNNNPNNATNTTATSYELDVNITANNAPHDVTYESWTNACPAGALATCNGFSCCTANLQHTTNTIHIPSGQTATVQLLRNSLTGKACGSYQMDFNVNSVDGNTGCQFGNGSNNIGATGICQTLTTCTGPTVTPTPPGVQITGNVYLDYNNNGTSDANYTNAATVTVANAGGVVGTTTTDASGNYTISNLPTGTTYTVTLTTPSGYKLNTGTVNPQTVNASTTVNFGLTPLLTISGNVFVDANSDGTLNNGETNYTGGTVNVNISGPVSIALSSANGTFTSGQQLTAGTYTVSYTSGVPTGYYLTYPLNGPPPSFTVQIGQGGICTTNGANGASCTNGSISNLNFGFNNKTPWYQSFCGDVRVNNGITDTIPAAPTCGTTTGAYLIQTSAGVCTNPGIAFSGTTNPNLGTSGGQASAAPYNWTVGTSQYPSLLKTTNTVHTSYAYLLAKMRQSGITATDLSTKCTLSNCTLPATLPHGLYQASGNVNLQAFTFPAAQDYVFLINGDLTLSGNISIPVGSTALFSAGGNIYVANTVGSSATTTTSNLDGFYSADKSFVVNSTGVCPDLRLNIAGSVVVNAGLKGGAFTNNRDLCTNNNQCPALSITQRPDFLIHAPSFLKYANHIWQELAPGSFIAANTPTPTSFVPTATPIGSLTATPTVTPTPAVVLADSPASSSIQTSSVNSFSWTHTVGNQSNRVLLVQIVTSASTNTVSAVKVNGSSITKLSAVNCGTSCRDEVWYLLNPASGTNTIAVTTTTSAPVTATAISLYNVNQTTPFGTVSSATGTGTASLVSPATNTTQLVADFYGNQATTPFTPTVGSGQTQMINVGNSIAQEAAISTEPGGAASTAITWTWGTANGYADIAMGINPAATGSTATPTNTPIPTLSPIPTPTPAYICSSSSNQQCNWSTTGTCSVNNQYCYCNDPKYAGHDEQYQCISGSWKYLSDVTSVCSASACKN